MAREFALSLLFIAIVVQALCLGAPASAQYVDMKLGEQLPGLFLRICPDLASAREQRDNANYRSSLPLDQVRLKDLIVPRCIEGAAIATPLYQEQSIPPGLGWNPIFDSNGKYQCIRRLRDLDPESKVTIPCTWIVQETRIYYVEFDTGNGGSIHGYAEMFPTNITLQYMEHLEQNGAPP